MDDKNQKMNPRLIFVIALSALVLLVVFCGATAVLLRCRKTGRPSNAVGPVVTSSKNKKSGGMSLSFIFPIYLCGFTWYCECLSPNMKIGNKFRIVD